MHTFVTLTFFSALTAAVPHAHGHYRLHARNSIQLDVPPIAGRSEAVDLPVNLVTGECGGSSGFGCSAGYCCSQWGFCGVTDDYCGAGCQFGSCNSTSFAPAASNATSSEAASVSVSSTEAPATSTSLQVNKQAVVTHTNSTEAIITQSAAQSTEESAAVPIATKAFTGPPGYGPLHSAESQWSAPPAQSTTFATSTATSTSAWVAPASPYSSPSQEQSTHTPALTSAAPVPATTSAPAAYTPAPSSASPSSSAAVPSSSASGGSGLGDKYTMYNGDGTTGSGWPSQSEWVGDFDTMWTANEGIMACDPSWGADNSPEESANLKSAIQSVASAAGLDPRFILAIVMQESKGCVRVITTMGSIANPGLMQDHGGAGSCNNNGNVQNPCPMTEITQMIHDGVYGTVVGNEPHNYGLQEALGSAGTDDVSKYYKAAKLYNSGINSDIKIDLSKSQSATACYAADIANRLTGWVHATHGCGA